jgi:hypothetical protein
MFAIAPISPKAFVWNFIIRELGKVLVYIFIKKKKQTVYVLMDSLGNQDCLSYR